MECYGVNGVSSTSGASVVRKISWSCIYAENKTGVYQSVIIERSAFES